MSTVFEVSPERWNKYERGREALTGPVALALCDRFELSLNWIYRGERGELPARVLRAIEDTESVPAAESLGTISRTGRQDDIALGYPLQTKFLAALAPCLDVSVARWCNYETARQRISIDVALALKARWGSLDWIYAGERARLPHELAMAIDEIERARARSLA